MVRTRPVFAQTVTYNGLDALSRTAHNNFQTRSTNYSTYGTDNDGLYFTISLCAEIHHSGNPCELLNSRFLHRV